MRPPALDRVPEAARVDLDVRDDLRAGRAPLARITAAADALGPGQVLVLRAPFEPVPLYRVLGRRGLAHWAEARSPDDWSVWFYREGPAAAPPAGDRAAALPGVCPGAGAGAVPLDVRRLEPPLPMVRVLEAVERLGAGERLEVLHDRRPLFLYPQLEDRKCRHRTDELGPGLVRITIWREDGAP
jgi:uncharacterized protein (DUF2249 family)